MELFQPLNGRCPVCGGQVGLVEGLVFDYTLDQKGFIGKSNSETYRAVGYCSNCKEERFVVPNDDGSYTVYHPDGKAVPYLLKNTDIKRSSIFSKCSTMLETMHLGDDNPFVESEETEDFEVPF